MKALIWRYVPYLVAAFMVANGFYIAKVQSLGVDEIISPSTLGGRLMAQRAVGAAESVDH